MELERFWRLIPDRESLDDLTQAQAQAIFRLLIVASLADDSVSDEERMTLAQALTRLPFFRPEDWSIFEQPRGLQILGNLHERYTRDPVAVLEEIRAELPDERVRVLALRLVALFMHADGFADDEHSFCLSVGQAFGLSTAAVNAVLQAVVAWVDGP